jgi:phosphoserine phosphatase
MSSGELKLARPSRMFYVATLISSPDRAALSDPLVQKVARYLPHGRPVDWLAPGLAVDVAFLLDGADARAADTDTRYLLSDFTADIRDITAGEPIDVIIQPHDGRRKRLLVADMDSTMIAQECIDELADFAGFKSRVAAITERAMRGEIAFEPALRERVALLEGLSATVIDDVLAERIRLMPGGRTLVATMRANGAYTCVVSGGFTAFTARIAAAIGFDEHRANTLLTDTSGKLTGRVAEPIVGREAKFDTLVELRERFGLAPKETLAVGDGANDIPMVKAAGLGVAYHGKPAIRDAVPLGCIDNGDLTALLYAQGYRREEFIEPEAEQRG